MKNRAIFIEYRRYNSESTEPDPTILLNKYFPQWKLHLRHYQYLQMLFLTLKLNQFSQKCLEEILFLKAYYNLNLEVINFTQILFFP